jgi:amylosucrase
VAPAPSWSRASVDAALGPTLDAGERDRFWARVETHLDRALGPLEALYGERSDLGALVEELLVVLAQATTDRPRALRRLDVRRELDPLWFQHQRHVGYVAYAARFGGSLSGVAAHLDVLEELGVTYLHLMGVLRSRPGPDDGGYAVVDHADVDPAVGTWDDLVALADALRARGISLCLDVVLNHTAREHPWAELARAGVPTYRDYYLVFPDRTLPDRYESTLPEVFPELAPGNFTFDPDLDGWVWTTFHSYQWDLNHANPAVLVELLEAMLRLANAGVEVLRLDAIAFCWKRLGTSCQNQPEVHLLVQVLRALLAVAAPAVLLKGEAIVAPDDLVPYLGAHERFRPECHLAYHNQLMVMVWSALAEGDARLAAHALGRLPATPPSTTWVTYVRCHDDIGWAVADADAAAVGRSGPAHRRYLARFYRGDFPGSWAEGAPFSTNAAVGDERTCGTAASLSGITGAARRADAAGVEAGVRRLLLAYALAAGFGGIPLVFMGDEVALANDDGYAADPAHAEDSRWMHRPVMDWAAWARRQVPGTVEHAVFHGLVHLLATRKATPAAAGGGTVVVLDVDDPAVLAWRRDHPAHGRLVGLANVAAREASVPADLPTACGLRRPVDALGGKDLDARDDRLVLAPYGVAWLVDDADGPVVPAPGPR